MRRRLDAAVVGHEDAKEVQPSPSTLTLLVENEVAMVQNQWDPILGEAHHPFESILVGIFTGGAGF